MIRLTTIKGAENAAKRGKIAAIRHSILHHGNLSRIPMTQLEDKIDWVSKNRVETCAICQATLRCQGCLLAIFDKRCSSSDSAWHAVMKTMSKFRIRPTKDNYTTFIRAEKAMVKTLKALLKHERDLK